MTNEEQGIRGALSMLATLTAEGHEELEEKLRAQEKTHWELEYRVSELEKRLDRLQGAFGDEN